MSPEPSGESVLNHRVQPVLSHLRASSGGRVRWGATVAVGVGLCWVPSGLPEVRWKRTNRVTSGVAIAHEGRCNHTHTCKVSA